MLRGVKKTFQNETKEQKGDFLGMLWSTLGATLLVNIVSGLTGKAVLSMMKKQLESVKIFEGAPSFNLIWNTKI